MGNWLLHIRKKWQKMLCLKHIRMAIKPIFECFTHKFKKIKRTNKKKYSITSSKSIFLV